MQLMNLAAETLAAARSKEISATALSEAVAGSSGKGNPQLTQNLFPMLARQGWLKASVKGRATFYMTTEKGLAQLDN